MKEVLDLEIRQKIFDIIVKNPGLHSLKIANILKISSQLADYHLLYLVRNELVTVVKEEGYNRYYVKGEIGTFERKYLALLRQEIPLKCVLYILKYPGSKHKDILEYLDVSPSTLSYHLKKLINNNIVEIRLYEEQKEYYIKDRRKIIRLLMKYKPYSWVDNFEDVWEDFTW
jgi:predicted transcriptional regulator